MRSAVTACLLGMLLVGLAPVAMEHKAEAASPRREAQPAPVMSKTGKALTSTRGAAARQAARPVARAASPAAARPRQAAAKPAQVLRQPKLQRTASRAPQARVVAPQRTSWQAGLPMASGEQRECPIGTMATLARGHDDVVRCLPL
ncbi:hypothetical protein [Teichococcus oryzae]|uniref:Uncharacterized protein n=1 Tax=Teichococcus oryzae TaxID=1608942 RepID=A0A5B2TKX0_9PROT|nr:hypothetical protein [Pseudoroseomonas oryzae]KAA2214568.1 hypothetical protein F0Q34_02350 [Pseudoroseomonas oryzae]